MTETTETNVVTEIPAAKQRKLRNPLAKKSETVPTDVTETPKPKRFGLSGAHKVGLLLVAGGVVAAAASRLGKSDGEDSDVPSDTDTTDN